MRKRLISTLAAIYLATLTPAAYAAAGSFGEVMPTNNTNRVTYMCNTLFVTPYAATQDLVTFFGSATKTVKILKITLTCTITSGQIDDTVYLYKRSTANTGTSGTVTTGPCDSADGSSTAAFKTWSAAPTTSGGNNFLINTITTDAVLANHNPQVGQYVLYDASLIQGKPITLHGVNDGVAITYNGVKPSGTGPLEAVTVTWTEE